MDLTGLVEATYRGPGLWYPYRVADVVDRPVEADVDLVGSRRPTGTPGSGAALVGVLR